MRSQAGTRSLLALAFLSKLGPLDCIVDTAFHVSATPMTTGHAIFGRTKNSVPRILYTVVLDPTGDSEMLGGSLCGGIWEETLVYSTSPSGHSLLAQSFMPASPKPIPES